MTQSDSPDFEFDISDLEVERDESAASRDGSSVSGESEGISREKEVQVPDQEDLKPDPRKDFDESDRELDVFEIDDLPSSEISDDPLVAESAKVSEEASAVADESENEPEVHEVQRVEAKPEPKPSRVLGADDLGADVFEEIESELDSMGLADVIDDLMDEVEDFEAGGFVELDDEEASSVSGTDDGLFKMDDPDDSLRNSVNPEAEVDSFEESTAFPSPPSDFEIPADPEPPKAATAKERKPVETVSDEVLEDSERVVESVSPTPPVAEAVRSAPPPDFSDFEIPADPVSEPSPIKPESPVVEGVSTAETRRSDARVSEPSEPVATPRSQATSEPRSERSPAQELEAAADPVEVSSEAEPKISMPEPAAEAATETETHSMEPEPEPEPEVVVESAEPVDGHEKVLFSSDIEEQAPEANSEEEDEPAAEMVEAGEEPVSELDEESPVEEAVPEALVVEDRELEVAEESAEEADAQVSEPEFVSDSDQEPVAEIEEEEDLSTLLDSIGEEDAEGEGLEDVPEVSAKALEPADDVAPELEENEASEVEAEAIEEDVPGLVEVAEEEEDISDLLASVIEEEEGEEEASAEVPGLVEVEDDAVSQESSDDEDAPVNDIPSPENLSEDEADKEAEAVRDESADGAIPGLVEVAEEEDEDISDLLASVIEEEEGEEEASAEIPGLVEVEDDAVTPESSDGEESPEDLSGEASESEDVGIPGLVEVEDESDDEEIVELSQEIPGLVEVPEDSEEEDSSEAVTAMPSAEELLMKAGSLLDGDSQKPAEGASALLDVLDDDDDEEIVAMPSPDQLMSAAAADDDDDEVVSLPDPSSLITEDGEAVAVIDDDDDEEVVPAPANVADRAGNLPPPPPAPVEIIDEEPPDEDVQSSEPVETAPFEPVEAEREESLEDPFDGEISLDDFDEGFAELDVEPAGEGELDENLEDSGEEGEVAAKKEVVEKIVEMPKPSLLWRVTHSMAVAAGLVLVGLASVLAVWKQQIIEYYDGRDIDGSALLLEIEEIGKHALSEFDENGLYRMQWVDSEVRRVSENEIRLHAVVGAQLRQDLYRPVLESRLEMEKENDEQKLLESLAYARDHYPEEIGNFPERPWNRLYEISSKKEEVLPLRVTYGLQRDSADSDWKLTRIKVNGYNGDLEWPEGEPKYSFGENAYDVHSLEFAKVYADYRAASESYVAKIDRLRAREEDGMLALKRENENQRMRVKMALSEGAFFNGMAIMGEDAKSSHDVQLVITEVRNDGRFVKGVVKLAGEKDEHAKHFVGSLEFEKTMSGREQGFLSLKTVSIDTPETYTADSPFFEAGTVSRMRLRADGFRLEGDTKDLSFRFTRSL